MERYSLDAECQLTIWRGWLAADEATRVHAALAQQLDWEQRSVHIFGRWIPQPRLIAWAGDVPYRYSGLALEPRPICGAVGQLMLEVNELTRTAFNHVLLNRYRDGNDSMGWHADDEAELGREPPIASVSLGAPRDFLVRAKANKERSQRRSFTLGSGDVLLMAGATQHRFVHALPKRSASRAERISLTFRRVLTAP
jgi:alkylated DNA repair dioxygenase AlkB